MQRVAVRVAAEGLGEEVRRIECALRPIADVARVTGRGLAAFAAGDGVDVLVVGVAPWRALRDRLPGDLGPRPAVLLVRSAGEPWVSPDEVGADDVVTAPVHPDELAWRVRDVVRRRAVRARLDRVIDGLPTLAHDLRAPVSGTLIRLDLLRRGSRGALSEAVLADLATIERTQRALVLMLGDLGELGRASAGGERFPVDDLARVAAEVVREVRTLARSTGVVVDVRAPPGPVPCRLEPHRLRHALRTLLCNAVGFTPEGSRVTVEITTGRGGARVTVTDGGPPLAPGVLDRVFEPRARALDEAHQVAGSALGLSLVRRIAEAHGGRAGAEVRGEVGTRFWIELPIEVSACPA